MYTESQVVWDFAMHHLVGIDMILGINWLSQNYSIIDCKKREIYLFIESVEDVRLSWGKS